MITYNSLLNSSRKLISYGAMITSVKVPSKLGEVADVALGFDSMEGKSITSFRKAESDIVCREHWMSSTQDSG